jgi:hypothetical protein
MKMEMIATLTILVIEYWSYDLATNIELKYCSRKIYVQLSFRESSIRVTIPPRLYHFYLY